MTNSVFVATRRDLADVQSVMDKAFADDPTVLWVSDLPEIFANEHHRYVQLCAEPAFDLGGVHATTDFKGAAIWYPPEIGVSDADYEQFKKTVRFPDKIDGLGELVEACDQYRPEQPHWTLELIAVDPAAQNEGIGGKLMAFGLAISDRAGLPAFLASSNSANLPFYERLGFSQVAKVRKSGMPTMYPMIRQCASLK
jgi:GNAT superfamily N-acetyltransferase